MAAKTLTTSEGTSEWEVHQSLVDSLRKAVVEEFGGKVLADKIRPDPPNRGKNCVPEIVLKQGAQSKEKRAMQLSGERLKAMKDVTAEWLAEKKIEEGKGPWSSSCLPVATKTPNKWRGVVDMRHVNEQCVEDAHRLPRIEDMLVQQGAREISRPLNSKMLSIRCP